jgi:glycosyltransferase involved in cell wall biosynthesis
VPEAHLQILGSGPYEKELHALAARLGVADRVSIRLVPPTDRMAMAVGLGQSAVVSALSDYEAHPVAVMEALSAGVPVVGTDIAGVGDLVEDGLVTGVAVTAGPEVVADALIRAMGQGRGPRRPVPTWEQATERILEVYAQALGRSSYRGVEAVGARPA